MEDVEDLLFDEHWLVITNCFQTKAYGGYDELLDKVRGYVVLKGQSCFTSFFKWLVRFDSLGGSKEVSRFTEKRNGAILPCNVCCMIHEPPPAGFVG